MRKLAFVVGVGVGYVLGTKAGRDQYDKMASLVRDFRGDPTVRQVADAARAQAAQLADEGRSLIRQKTDQASKQLGTDGVTNPAD